MLSRARNANVQTSSTHPVETRLPVGSINHAAGKADAWLKLEVDTHCIAALLRRAVSGFEIAEQFCNAAAISLDEILRTTPDRRKSDDGLIVLPKRFSDAIDQVCNQISNDSYRYTAKTRAKRGILLLRTVLTLAASKDLRILQPATGPARATVGEPSVARTPAAAIRQHRVSEISPSSGGDRDAGYPALELEVDVDAVFRSFLTDANTISPSPEERFFPAHFGLDLEELRRLCCEVLGAVQSRDDVEIRFEPTTPLHTKCNYDHLLAIRVRVDANDIPDDRTTVIFPAAQWASRPTASSDIDPSEYAKAVAAIRRKRQRHVLGTPMFYTYGVLREIQETLLSGTSLIVVGISGAGKSTLLSQVRKLGVSVFELGNSSDNHTKGKYSFRYDQIQQLIKKARRISGRKILVTDELYIEPSDLQHLGMFSQFMFVGDPRQPGTSRGAQHLFKFVDDIGGKSFTLPVVWRAINALSMFVVNFLGYGSNFTICPPSFRREAYQFEILECDDSPRIIAAIMIAYALEKASAGFSVIITANAEAIVRHISELSRHLPEFPPSIECRYANDIQGREADIIVADLHDLASAVQGVEHALKFALMMLGRARYTTCLVLGQRNMSVDCKSALPLEVFMGVALRQRLRQRETNLLYREDDAMAEIASDWSIRPIDEETIAVINRRSDVVKYFLVKDRSSHNVIMLGSSGPLIEAPEFFVETPRPESEMRLLVRIIQSDKSMRIGIHSWSDVQAFLLSVEERRF